MANQNVLLSPEQYAIERAICDKAAAYAETFRQKNGWISIPKDDCSHPDYAACDNAMRSRVEQYEFFRDMPDKYTAYITGGATDWRITTFTGLALSSDLVVNNSRPMRGFMSSRYYYGCTVINGQSYAWQGHGAGMYCRLRKIKNRKAA